MFKEIKMNDFSAPFVLLNRPIYQLVDDIQRIYNINTSEFRKNLIREYYKFPWAIFVSYYNHIPIAFVAISFQKSKFIIKLLNNIKFYLPLSVSKLLFKINILRDYELANIHLIEEFRGTGLSDELLTFVERFAIMNFNKKEIYLLVRADNARALNFYKKKNYSFCGKVNLSDGIKFRLKKYL